MLETDIVSFETQPVNFPLPTFSLSSLNCEPETGPLSGEARRGLEGVDTDRGKVIAEGGAGAIGSGLQSDHEGITTTVDETCADVNL